MLTCPNFWKDENHLSKKAFLLSFICSILVIYIHAYNLKQYDINNDMGGMAGIIASIENCWKVQLEIAVPFFFMLSGYFLFRKKTSFLLKLTKRIRTLLIPYIIWCILYYVFFAVITNIKIIAVHMNHPQVEISLFELIKWIFLKEYYTLRFLKNLIIYLCITPIIQFILRDYKYVKLGWVAVIIVGLLTDLALIKSSLFNGLFFYLVGSWIGINYPTLGYYKDRKLSLISLVGVAVLFLLSFKYWNIYLILIYIIFLWFAVDLLDFEYMEIKWWMKISFFIYVAHDIILESFEKLFLLVFGKNPIFALIDYIFMPILVYCFLVLLASILKRYTPKIWFILCGGRG